MRLTLETATYKLDTANKSFENVLKNWNLFKKGVEDATEKIEYMRFSTNKLDAGMVFYINIFNKAIKCWFCFCPEKENEVRYSIKAAQQPDTCYKDSDNHILFNHNDGGGVRNLSQEHPEQEFNIESAPVIVEHLKRIMAMVGISTC